MSKPREFWLMLNNLGDIEAEQCLAYKEEPCEPMKSLVGAHVIEYAEYAKLEKLLKASAVIGMQQSETLQALRQRNEKLVEVVRDMNEYLDRYVDDEEPMSDLHHAVRDSLAAD
jgi:hypothetical protein